MRTRPPRLGTTTRFPGDARVEYVEELTTGGAQRLLAVLNEAHRRNPFLPGSSPSLLKRELEGKLGLRGDASDSKRLRALEARVRLARKQIEHVEKALATLRD